MPPEPPSRELSPEVNRRRSPAALARAAKAACLQLAFAPAAFPAFAHGGEDHGAAPAWTFDPWITVPLFLFGALYALGTAKLWAAAGRGRGIGFARAGAYLAGWLALAGALVSPLHWLGEHLFTFHMIEHELVIAVAAPLLVLARPVGAFLWALPEGARALAGGIAGAAPVRAVWRWLVRPPVATLLHGLAIWVWHVPSLFDLAVENVAAHRLQHLSFLLTALLFWWALLRLREPVTGVVHLLLTMVHTGLLGALMVFSPRVLYAVQTAYAPEWGLTPLEDQQFAGVVMWVPAGLVYAGAALVLLGLRLGREQASSGAGPRA